MPAVAVLNGLTPYTEVKTGFGWNMYSNLAVVDGESNHLIVRAGLPLTGDRRRSGRDRPDRRSRSRLLHRPAVGSCPERQLLDYLAGPTRRGRSTGRLDGEPVTYVGGRGGARPTWQQKFQVFRAVDASGPTNCQASFGPAR